MKSLSSWLVVIFMFMFWVFRVIITICAEYGSDNFGGFIAFNLNVETILLFVTILCMVLTLRRNIFGGIIYIISYGYYFGGYILTNGLPALTSGEAMSMSVLQNVAVSFIRIDFTNMYMYGFICRANKKKRSKG